MDIRSPSTTEAIPAPPREEKRPRIEWIDAARGLGIVLVVLSHVARGLVSANIAQGPFWAALDFTLYTFHMPLFFFLAGLNARKSVERSARSYLLSKVVTVAYPYVLWSLIQGLILVAASSQTNRQLDVHELAYIGWSPMAQFWFLYALMLCHIVLAIVNYRPIALAVIAIGALAASQFLPNDVILERFTYSLPFFLVGVLTATRALSWPGVKSLAAPALLWALFAGAVWAASLVAHGDYSSIPALPAALLGAAALVATASALPAAIKRWAVALGEASMSIYVMHIIVAAGLRIVLVKLHVPPIAGLYALLCTGVGVAAPFVAHLVLTRWGLLPPLGLAAPRWLSKLSRPASTETRPVREGA